MEKCYRCGVEADLTAVRGFYSFKDEPDPQYMLCKGCLEALEDTNKEMADYFCNPDKDVCGFIVVEYKHIDKMRALFEKEPEFKHLVKWLEDVKDDAKCFHEARCKE